MKVEKKAKKRRFVIEEPVFKSKVTILVNYSFNELMKIHEKYKHESESKLPDKLSSSNGLCLKVKNHSGQECFILWQRYFTWKIVDIGIFTHELMHLVAYICESKQIEFRTENDEVIAYLLEYYQVEAHKKLHKL